MAENFEKAWWERHPPYPVYKNGTDEILYWKNS